MRCMGQVTESRAAGSAKRFTWVVFAAMASTAPAQQATAVPTDHYAPPVCAAGPKQGHSESLDRARTEQKDALTDSHLILSGEPIPNFGVERYKLAEYGECTGDSGCYWADLDAQYKRAEAELAKAITTKRLGSKPAIVMDIDETTLTNYCELRREDFGFIESMTRPWEISPESSIAIPGALRLFNKAREAGIAVFFITGRPGKPDPHVQYIGVGDETAATARNLETAGFHGWAGLRLRNGNENHMPTIAFKTQERRLIAADGYRIIMSIGDQWSDLLGDPQADISIKLPNPFYFIP
jgi:HAD superfamily, subfamily IIIB (Acid phosphatase)